MKGGEEEREKAKGRKRRSEHRDRSVILLDSARSPVTFECSVDFTLAKGEHRRKKKKTRTSIPSWLPSLFVLPPSSSPSPSHFSISSLETSIFSLFLRQFSFDPRRSKKRRYDLYPRSRSKKRRRRRRERRREGERERERRIDRDSP